MNVIESESSFFLLKNFVVLLYRIRYLRKNYLISILLYIYIYIYFYFIKNITFSSDGRQIGNL